MFDAIRELFTLKKAARQYGEIRKEVDSMDTKHLFLSKTFWVNVCTLGLTIAGVLPQKWAAPVIAVSSVGMRLVSNQPVSLSPSLLINTITDKLSK